MKSPDRKTSSDENQSPSRSTRRDFLKLSAVGALGAVSLPAMAGQLPGIDPGSRSQVRSNGLPGRIVICHDPLMEGHLPTVNKDRVEDLVQRSVRLLTGISDTGTAFESLFPGVHSGSTFAIKVNCIGSTCTRWEVVRGIVSGLSKMLGNTFDVSQATIYDRDNPHYNGYQESEFTFNGNTVFIANNNNASGSGYPVWQNHELSRYVLQSDFVINVPVLKSHSITANGITVALKNHYGSCTPSSLCGDIPGMLALNSDANVKAKTGLVITDALRATYTGGPSEPPQGWNLYPENTPNTMFVTTDPVTNEYWARDLINAQRTAYGYSQKSCPWVEQASGAPYEIGVSDPSEMEVIHFDLTGVEENAPAVIGGTFLARNTPNPFSQSTTLRFRMAEAGPATIQIVDVSGRVVQRLGGQSYQAGYNEIHWDGRDTRGHRVATGVYFARLMAGRQLSSRRIVVAR